MKNTRILWFLLLYPSCLAVAATRNESEAPACLPHLSVTIHEGEYEILQDGRLFHHTKSHVYPAGKHWYDNGTRRGCICDISSTPCLRKCCGVGESLVQKLIIGSESHCVPDTQAPKMIKLNGQLVADEMKRQLQTRPAIHDWFTLVESEECAEQHVVLDLNPKEYPEDEYVILANGSLLVNAQGLISADKFCLDHRIGSDPLEIAVLTCMYKGDENSEEESLDPFHKLGYTLSLPFLAVTFVVYAIIPELRNIYGKTLMCYVVSLLSAYVFIVISDFFEYGTECITTETTVAMQHLSMSSATIERTEGPLSDS